MIMTLSCRMQQVLETTEIISKIPSYLEKDYNARAIDNQSVIKQRRQSWGLGYTSRLPHLGMGMVLRWCRGVSMKCYHIL